MFSRCSRIDGGENRRTRQSRSVTLVLACAVVLLAVSSGQADDIKVKGLWYRNVTIDKFEGGKIYFTPAGGRPVKADIRQLEELKVKKLPALADAEERFYDNNFALAFKAYQSLRNKVREKWLKIWIEYRLVKCADRMGLADQSLGSYLNLAKLNPDDFFLRSQPVDSLGSITKKQKEQFIQRVNETYKRVRGSKAKAQLKLLKESLEAVQTDASKTTTNPSNGNRGTTTTSRPSLLPKRRPSKTLFTRELEETQYDGIKPLVQLRRGDYKGTLDTVNTLLNRRDTKDVSLMLYIKALAQLALAEDGDTGSKAGLFKDAGVTFMQVAILYPKSNWAGHSLMEAGYVHMRIGRKDLVRGLYSKAGVWLDPDEEPELADRLDKLVTELSKAK